MIFFRYCCTKLGITTDAASLDSYAGKRFKGILEKEVSAGRILVRTHLINSDGGTAQLDDLLHHADCEWRGINVIAGGRERSCPQTRRLLQFSQK